MHGPYHAEVNSTTVRDLTVPSVSNLPLSAMVRSCHSCVNLSRLPGLFHANAVLWQVALHRLRAGHGTKLRGHSVFIKYSFKIYNIWPQASKQASKQTYTPTCEMQSR